MKRLTTYLILALMSICAVAQNRPKVALVLSGGGAKGAAHVGALKVLEEVGIPIDMIVGTSMGSLAGGLYAYGYNADQLDSILSCQDWMSLLMDKKPRIEMTLADRMMADKYALNIQFHKSPSEVLEGGILKGNSVAKLLCELTSDRLEPMDYSTLPIPFACVATDIAGNQEVDMTSGIPAESMRSSMSIPGVFSPVRKGDMVLVDGGMENNYPVDLARKLGADIVIGVDVTTPAMSPDEIKTAPEVLSQILDNACKNKYHENVAQTDIHIRVNVDGYSSSSFKPEAIDTLMQRGVFATQQVMPQLLALRKQLGLEGTPITPKPALHHVNNKNLPAVSTIYDPNEKKNWLGFGARFDDEENAAIILGGRYWFKHKIVPNVYTEIRLGERMWGKFGSNFQLGRNWWMDGGYKLTYANSKLYEDGDEKNDIEYVQNNAWLQFTKQWHNITFNLGGEFTQTNYDPLVVEEVESTGNSNYNGPFKPSHKNWWHERNVKYYVNAVFDNMDARAFPTRGVQWSVAYEYYTDNGATYNGDMGMHQASVKFRAAIPLTKNSTLLPRFAARYIPNDNFHYFNQNYIGGIDYDGRYLSQQISFAGIKYAQEANNFFGVVGATFRQSFPKNHFAFAVFNYGMGYGTGLIKGNGLVVQNTKNHTTENYYGTALGYGYRTPIGPIEADFGYSNQSRFSFTIQLGYKF